ncbi:MAG TPA: hypothetical protein VG253_13340 [Streptosporangiaceae bacterium]|nr:hypothetical protein [Streptosporangiaceae bacterium]
MGRAGDDPLGQQASGPLGTLHRDVRSSSGAGPADALRIATIGAARLRPAASRWTRRGSWRWHALLLAGYLAAGIALTWPRATYLAGRLPATRDSGGYVWDLWWVAHQVIHMSSPWTTNYQAAPVGTSLAFHTLMPLVGLLMTPVTLLLGPSASANLLAVLCPGLLCYVMYRAARLWLPDRWGPIAAGGFFGLSPILAWRSWYEVNLAAGALFLPMALEAAVRLRRRPGARQAVILGVVIGAAVLTDQESAVLAAITAGLVAVPWLLCHPTAPRIRAGIIAAAVCALVAGPQIAAMTTQRAAGGVPPGQAGLLDVNYIRSGAGLWQLFAPSPRVADVGLSGLSQISSQGPDNIVVVTFGAVLASVALFGLVVSWRRRTGRLLGLMWLACTVLALGSALWIGDRMYVPLAQVVNGVPISPVLPFTWFVHIPGLSGFREADRFTELALVPAALLAGAAVSWLRVHARMVLIPVLVLAVLEAGWAGTASIGTMATAMPALDDPIAAQHTKSLVVDLPFGIRGGLPVTGYGFAPQSMVLATADGHPLADAWISRIPDATLAGIRRRAFYTALLNAQSGRHHTTEAEFDKARANARHMHIGWILVWRLRRTFARLLRETGFRFAYRADGVLVYRPARSGSESRPSAARPRTSPRRPAESPALSSADRAATIRACLDCHARHSRSATSRPAGVRYRRT